MEGETVRPVVLPCPFCGGQAISLYEGSVGGHFAAAMCDQCHAYGPEARSTQEAQERWNARAMSG